MHRDGTIRDNSPLFAANKQEKFVSIQWVIIRRYKQETGKAGRRILLLNCCQTASLRSWKLPFSFVISLSCAAKFPAIKRASLPGLAARVLRSLQQMSRKQHFPTNSLILISEKVNLQSGHHHQLASLLIRYHDEAKATHISFNEILQFVCTETHLKYCDSYNKFTRNCSTSETESLE